MQLVTNTAPQLLPCRVSEMLIQLISIVLGRFCIAFDRFGGELSWRIGVVAGSRIQIGRIGIVGWCSIRSRVVLRYLGGVARGRRIIFRGFGVVAVV
jgi:hypothetical protein